MQESPTVRKHLTPSPLTPWGVRHTFGGMRRPISPPARPSLVAIALFAATAVLGTFPVQSQEEASPRTHTVERGETLWQLAGAYFGNGQAWQSIFDANRERIENPNRLVPGQVLVIPEPGPGAAVTGVVVKAETPDAASGASTGEPERTDVSPGPRSSPAAPSASTAVRPADVSQREGAWIPRDVFLSASWLEPMEEVEGSGGTIVGYSAGDARDVGRTTARPFELLRVAWSDDRPPSPGEELLTYRVIGAVEDVGRIAHPTGLLSVLRRDEAGVVARLSRSYDRVSLGDFVLPAPSMDLPSGAYPRKASEPVAATVVGFAWNKELHQVGDIVFLDAGEDAGVSLGDEFVAVGSHPEGWAGEVQGRLQVVRTSPQTSSARVLELSAPVLARGVNVILGRRLAPPDSGERR